MWILPAQELGDLDQALDKALTLVNGTAVYELSAAERAAIHVVYQLYEALSGQPHTDLTPAVLNTARASLYSAYDQVQIGGRLVSLRERILASTNQCPYCGFGEPRDLDHYLPRSVFGELAIYPRNLIPSCSACNNAKRTVVPGLDPTSGPSLIHPYFQELPDVEFLVADVAFENGALQVSYRINAELLEETLAAKLQFQIDRLKLNQRYNGQINKFLSEQRAAMLMLREIGTTVFSEYLIRCAASLRNSFGFNDWRPALLRALGGNPDFCSSPAEYLGN